MTRLNWQRANELQRIREWDRDHPGDRKGGSRRGTSQRGNPANVVHYNASPQCTAIKKDGTPCQGKAKHGYDVCGPHLDQREKRR